MAYNNQYSGYGSYPFPTYTNDFNQQYGRQQQPQQPQVPYNNYQPQQPQQSQSNGSPYYYVNGVEGAKAFLLPPNASVVLFDSDSNKFYKKTTNAQGQATLQEFEYKQIAPKSPQNQEIDTGSTNYATKDDIQRLEQQISELVGKQKEKKQNV